ncbi:hypothetical protein D9M71_141700 [compost metagenome]
MQVLALLRSDDPGFALEQQLHARLIGDGPAEECATRGAIGACRVPVLFELPDQQAEQFARDSRDRRFPVSLVCVCRGLFRVGKFMGLPGGPTLMAIVQEHGVTQRQGIDPRSRRMTCVLVPCSRCQIEIHPGLALIHAGKRRGQLFSQQCIEQRRQGR